MRGCPACRQRCHRCSIAGSVSSTVFTRWSKQCWRTTCDRRRWVWYFLWAHASWLTCITCLQTLRNQRMVSPAHQYTVLYCLRACVESWRVGCSCIVLYTCWRKLSILWSSQEVRRLRRKINRLFRGLSQGSRQAGPFVVPCCPDVVRRLQRVSPQILKLSVSAFLINLNI